MIKNLFFYISLLFVLITTAHAQSFEFEVTKTPSNPGFFMIQIFPLEGNIPFSTNPVFVKNYEEDEYKYYKPLLDFIHERNGIIIEKQDVKFYNTDKENTIVYLGNPEKTQLSFRFQSPESILSEFEVFEETFLKNIVLRNIKTDFGGNVYDILPSYIPHITDKPIVIVGKFKKNMKTRFQIKGEIHEGEIESTEILPFDETDNAELLNTEIPSLWEILWKQENPPQKDNTHKNTWIQWENSFPILLFLLGIFFFVLAIKGVRKNAQTAMDSELKEILKNNETHESIPLKRNTEISEPHQKPINQPVSSAPFVDMPQTQDSE